MLNIKMVKPKPKQYRIAYATLSYAINKQPKKITRSIAITPPKNRDKWDDIIDKAIMKGIVDETERDITKSELSILSNEELENYIKTIEQAETINIEMIDENGNAINTVPNISDKDEMDELDEADAVLQKIKANGPIIGDFSHIASATDADTNDDIISNNKSTRSLADIKAEKEYDKLMSDMNISETIVESSFENSLKNVMAHKKDNTMTNFKGLTKPIIQSSNQTSNPMSKLFTDMDWSMGAR